MAAVAHGVEDAHHDVVHDDENGTAEIVAEIDDGQGEDFLGGVHEPQDGGSSADTQNRQQDAHSQSESHGGVNGLVHDVIILGAVVFGDDDTGTHRQAAEETHHQENQTAGGTDGGQGVVADEIAHSPGVEGVIKLLEHIAQEYGEGKQEDLFPDDALRQRCLVAVHDGPFFPRDDLNSLYPSCG